LKAWVKAASRPTGVVLASVFTNVAIVNIV
jgi:hypothetical protein